MNVNVNNDRVNTVITFEIFKKIPLIVKDCALNSGRYRIGFDKILQYTQPTANLWDVLHK